MSIEPSAEEPVRLFEDQTGDRFLIYTTQSGVRVELRYTGEALWMTQAQMSELFGRDVSVISRHIANVFEERELDEPGNLQFVQIARSTKPVALYSLDMILSVGYRVSSAQATLFRRWATGVLVRFATRGFVVDTERLRDAGDADRIAELRETIREIRSSEANVYAELRSICAMCQDYDPSSEAARDFYRQTQAKLFYAVVNRTPSELLIGRVDAQQPNMGLQTWPKDEIRQQDAVIAKNYLAPAELKELNRLTTILLDIFEDQLDIGRLTTMDDAARLLEQQLRSNCAACTVLCSPTGGRYRTIEPKLARRQSISGSMSAAKRRGLLRFTPKLASSRGRTKSFLRSGGPGSRKGWAPPPLPPRRLRSSCGCG